MLTVIALLIITASISGWDLAVNQTFWRTVWSAFWAGVVRISTAPLADWRAAIDRLLLAVGIVLLVSSFWSPLPAATTSGTHADLKQAIEQYQSAHGLGVDGVWGPATNRTYLKGL